MQAVLNALETSFETIANAEVKRCALWALCELMDCSGADAKRAERHAAIVRRRLLRAEEEQARIEAEERAFAAGDLKVMRAAATATARAEAWGPERDEEEAVLLACFERLVQRCPSLGYSASSILTGAARGVVAKARARRLVRQAESATVTTADEDLARPWGRLAGPVSSGGSASSSGGATWVGDAGASGAALPGAPGLFGPFDAHPPPWSSAPARALPKCVPVSLPGPRRPVTTPCDPLSISLSHVVRFDPACVELAVHVEGIQAFRELCGASGHGGGGGGGDGFDDDMAGGGGAGGGGGAQSDGARLVVAVGGSLSLDCGGGKLLDDLALPGRVLRVPLPAEEDACTATLRISLTHLATASVSVLLAAQAPHILTCEEYTISLSEMLGPLPLTR